MDKQLPKIKPKAEAQINDEDIKKYSPDLINDRHNMADELQIVHQMKPQFDQTMQQISQQTGVPMSSRVKDPKQIVRKITQKRMEDRNYKQSDLNDLIGYRFTYLKQSQEQPVIQAIKQAAKQGAFVLLKQEVRDKQNYHADHFDIAFPLSDKQAIRGEIQVMDAKSEAIAAVEHDDYFQHGDDLPQHIQKKVNKQEDKIDKLPPIKQKMVADTMVQAHKKTKDKPLPKGFGAKVIDTVAQT